MQFNTIQYNLKQLIFYINYFVTIVFINIFEENKEFAVFVKLYYCVPVEVTNKYNEKKKRQARLSVFLF